MKVAIFAWLFLLPVILLTAPVEAYPVDRDTRFHSITFPDAKVGDHRQREAERHAPGLKVDANTNEKRYCPLSTHCGREGGYPLAKRAGPFGPSDLINFWLEGSRVLRSLDAIGDAFERGERVPHDFALRTFEQSLPYIHSSETKQQVQNVIAMMREQQALQRSSVTEDAGREAGHHTSSSVASNSLFNSLVRPNPRGYLPLSQEDDEVSSTMHGDAAAVRPERMRDAWRRAYRAIVAQHRSGPPQ